MKPDGPFLIIIPIVPVAAEDGDRLLLDRKAVEGLFLYARYWSGTVRAVFRHEDLGTPPYFQWYDRADLPFEIVTVADGAPLTAALDTGGREAIVLAGADTPGDFGLVDDPAGHPVVYIIEYTLRTRLDIVALTVRSLPRRWRSYVWHWQRERERKRVFRRSAGLQANGTPAFEAYAAMSARPLLYFDTRLSEAMFVGIEAADAKAAALAARRPLRLGFSGRLEAMKGADHLIRVAEGLAARGVDFTLDIYGSGSLEPTMRAGAAAPGLAGRVRFHGAVPFETALVPTMKADIDLLLCCHRQADPSCTYLETLGCGVPIAGYLNEAFTGVLQLGDCGVGVGMDDVDALVTAVAALDADRARLGALTRNAALTARDHLFEPTFARRVAHLGEVLAASLR